MLSLLRGSSAQDSSSKRQISNTLKSVPTTNGHANTDSEAQNPLSSPRARPLSPLPNMSVNRRAPSRMTTSASFGHSHYMNTLVSEQHSIVRRRCQKELGNRVESHVFDTSFLGLLEWVRTERLTRLPHKGGSWDRVLIVSQHFADQVNALTENIQRFTHDSQAASQLIFGHLLLLLELGHENATALEKAFNMFYQFGLEMVPLLRRPDMFSVSAAISENLSRVFANLLNIVTSVAITFYQAVHGGRTSTVIDIYRLFGSQIEEYRSQISKASISMWDHSLFVEEGSNGRQLEILQKFLSPQDSILAFLAANRIDISGSPDQFTCTWFLPYLTSFVRGNDRILVVEGKSGSGKTTLANWTTDRLQRSIAKKSVTTITYFFNPSVPLQNTSLSMVKTLLYQLMLNRIGDVNLFSAVNEAFLNFASLIDVNEQEEKLWGALNNAVQYLRVEDGDDLVIIVDGIDEIEGQKPAAQGALQRLYNLTTRTQAIRLIQFSQPLGASPPSSTHVHLTHDVLRDDMINIVRQLLERHPQRFGQLGTDGQEAIIEQLVGPSDTSILWLHLACQFLVLQTGPVEKAVETILPTSKSINDAVQKVLSVIQLEPDARNIISFIATAERPLLFDEVKLLLQAQPDRGTMVQRTVDLIKAVSLLSPFVISDEGLVTIRHPSIKQALITLTGSSKIPDQAHERNRDFVTRLLIYAKTCLIGEHQPTLDSLETKTIDSKLKTHRFLEYVVRYWTIHFRKSSMYKPNASLELPKDFGSIFPTSIMFTLLEEGCWTSQVAPRDALDLHILAFQIRNTLFGSEQPSVLQSAIVVAKIYELILNRPTDAVDWYVRSSKISQNVLGIQSEMTITICYTILRITETHRTTTRTNVMTWREQTLLILITSYTQRYGATSKQVLEIQQKLLDLYIFLKEEQKVHEWKLKLEKETTKIRDGFNLDGHAIDRSAELRLRKHRHAEEVDSFEYGFLNRYEVEGEETELTFVQVEQILTLIVTYLKKNEMTKVEELYIELWLRLTEHCQHHSKVEWHTKKIEIMLAYAHFLQKQKRTSEASTILLCIWREYEHHELSSFESINVLLKEVAISMKSLGLLSISLAVLKKCWSWFKSSHREDTAIFKEIESNMTSISTEIVRSQTTVTSQTSETIIRGVFESAIISSETISTTTIELCQSLAATYIKEERYAEAISVIETALKKSWSSFFFESDKTITMSSSFTQENIELVMKLAHSYLKQTRLTKVEEIYIRLYRVHRKTYNVDHASVTKYGDLLISFYKEHGFFTKAIAFYQELLVDYRTFYGASHSVTIRTLYALGDLCRHHHLTHGYWIEYYLEIVNALNKGNLVSHEDALRALIIVAEHHYEALRFTEALVYFKSIFATFNKYGTKYKYFENTTEVHKLVEHYFRSIDESQIDVETHISMIDELRESCLKYYGESSAIAISTSTALATVCRRSEKHEFRAISLYEHISKHSKTVSREVKQSLQYLYYKRITSSTSTTTISKEVIEKAISMTYDRYVETRKTYSCTHEKTLTELKELVQLWHKQSKTELAVKEVQSITIETITSKTSSKELVESGRSLAEIYVFCSYQQHAYRLIRELRQQVIYKSVSKDAGFNVSTADRASLVFIASLEYHVRANYSVSLASIMADLTAEYSYYQRLTTSIKAKSSYDVVFHHGSRLQRILERTSRLDFFSFVESETVEYFSSSEPEVTKHVQQSTVKIFVNAVFKYVATHRISPLFTATAGHAAIAEIRQLVEQKKQNESLELTKCIFYYLMAHEGIDDPTEITMGFQLCLLMGRGNVDHSMIEFSRVILSAVFDICKNHKIDVARIQLLELNDLIEMVGTQKDYGRLRWLLQTLWDSRQGQATWPKDTVLTLGIRLVEAEFAAGQNRSAIRLCEDIVYNVRRVNGARDQNTVNLCELLSSLYTSAGVKLQSEKPDVAKTYFRKALVVEEDTLKALVGWEENDHDDDDDLMSEYTGSVRGVQQNGNASTFFSHQDEIDAVRRHTRKLRYAMQRSGGWNKPAGEFERLTDRVWSLFGGEMKLKEDEVRSNRWKVEKLGGDFKNDQFEVPQNWSVVGAA